MLKDIMFGDVASPSYQLNKKDLTDLSRTALLVGASAVVSFLINVLPGIDMGQWTGIAVPLIAFLLDAARKWLGSQLA